MRTMFRHSLRSLGAILVILVLSIGMIQPAFAGEKIVFDEDKYNLYTNEYPDGIYENVYATFSSSVSDPDTYYLNLLSEEAIDKFTAGLKKKGIDYNEDYVTGFEVSMWQETDEDDKQVYKGASIYIPLPDDAQEYPNDCTFYKVSGGAASVMPSKIYTDENDINYVLLTVTGKADFAPIYGFVYADPADLAEEEEEEQEDVEEEEEEEEDEDDGKPTKAPTKTPTKKPSSDSTPTKKPSSSSGKSDSSSKNKSDRKDSSPKTGDDFPLTGMICTSCGAAIVLAGAIIFIKKK